MITKEVRRMHHEKEKNLSTFRHGDREHLGFTVAESLRAARFGLPLKVNAEIWKRPVYVWDSFWGRYYNQNAAQS